MFYTIHKITENPVVDFAAEELKKYLRMMMPLCGEITIDSDPRAEGFRLGLMADFDMDTTEATDPFLDDIVHIDTTAEGGVIAGSNPRSVLLAVYKYLTLNGCRWLFPGIDGEFIPVRTVEAVCYHKMADNRYRGQCNEGAESQQAMIETIDFQPKIGMNMYMIEFDNPHVYYDWYYNHRNNDMNREPEPVSEETVLQWKRVCEVEIAKRGMQFHDKGHGWTADAFGIDSSAGWVKFQKDFPEENRKYLALIDGERDLYKGVALNTNFCMSNPEARKIFVDFVADYAQVNFHVDYLHVWLADGQQNHCECADCRKKNPSDWYVILLNELDEEMTRRGLRTRVVFCAYSDTAWPPLVEKLKNPDRFSMITSPITRSYTYSVGKNPKIDYYRPYELNRDGRLDTLEEHLAHTVLWREFAPCNSFVCEYHFWLHQFFAPGVLSFARRVHEDVKSYSMNGFRGIVEDCSQRCFFPNGLSFYVYAQTLFDESQPLESMIEDYMQHAYGAAAQTVMDFLKTIDELMPQSYLECRHSIMQTAEKFTNPAMEEKFLAVKGVAEALKEALLPFRNMPYRVQTVAVRLLVDYADYCTGVAGFFALRCTGKVQEARAAYNAFKEEFGKRELSIERYYDHFEATHAFLQMFYKK
ncbi:MAG: DUF4838 domain-containing protein [Clostridia bacterium]|nr:DUF4838 domain-containing protein [Clostridia bacterium]